jgi:hypothetical protein
MPEYIVTHKESGRKFKITGDRPPTQDEALFYMDKYMTAERNKPDPVTRPPLGVPMYASQSVPAVPISGVERAGITAAEAIESKPREFVRGAMEGGFLSLGKDALRRGLYGAPMYGYAQGPVDNEEPADEQAVMARRIGKGVSSGLQALAGGAVAAPLKGVASAVVGSLASTAPYGAEMVSQNRPASEIGKEAAIALAADLGFQALTKLPGFFRAIAAKGKKPAAQAIAEVAQEMGVASKAPIPQQSRSAMEAMSGIEPSPIPETVTKLSDLTPAQKQKVTGKAITAAGEEIEIPDVKLPFLKDVSIGEYRAIAKPKAPETIDMRTYLKQMQDKELDITNNKIKTPVQLSSQNAIRAFDEVDVMRQDAGKAIAESVAKAGKKEIDIYDIKRKFFTEVRKRIGDIDSPKVSSASEAKLARELEEYLFEQYPTKITADDGQKLKEYLREYVSYDTGGQLRKDTGKLQAIIKDVSNDLAGKISEIAPGYAEANAAYSKLINLEHLLSKALRQRIGTISAGGASLMKRSLESLADSGYSEILDMVKDVTGGRYDLAQDALYASIAQRLSSEPRYREQAMRFGRLFDFPGAGVKGEVTKQAVKGAEGIMKKGAPKRLDKFYEKAQKKYQVETSGNLQDLGQTTRAGERGAIGTDDVITDAWKNAENFTKGENFKRWFGDWQNNPESASKVVNNDGTPAVYYHGTMKRFKKLNKKKIGTANQGEGAFFATVDPEAASEYATMNYSGKMKERPNVMPVYVDIKNPYISDMTRYTKAGMTKEIKKAKSLGHDGAMFPLISDFGEAGQVAVFNENQFKSATGNYGMFSKFNKDMTGTIGGTEIMGGITGLGMLGAGAIHQLSKERKK